MKVDDRTKEVTLTEAEYVELVNRHLSEEPVSEDLEEAAENAIEDLEKKLTNVTLDEVVSNWLRCMFRAGALWQKEKTIRKACKWIKEINNHHYIMRYSDSCEPTANELIEWFKNYMGE